MKRILVIAIALFAAAPASAAERHYSITDFDRVRIEGPFQVTLATGRTSGATATGSQQALDRLTVEVQGRTLRIRPNRSGWGGYPGEGIGPVSIEIATRDLVGAAVIGPGSLSIDKTRGLRLDLSVSGSGKLGVASVDTDNLTVGLLGSGKIMLAGNAKQLQATIQGSGDLDAGALRADDAKITADTAGTIEVGAARTAKIKATGAGNVEIVGAPSCTVEALGVGEVHCGPKR